MCVCVCPLRCQRRISDPLDVELEAVVNHLIWVLGTKRWSFGRVVIPLTAKSSLQLLEETFEIDKFLR